jgi:long-chain acyl-CoA synthetase
MLLEQLAQQEGDSVALVDGQQSLTRTALLARVTLLCEFLRKAAFTRIGLLADNSMDWIVVDLACMAAGVTLVPLPVFFSDPQLQYVINSGRLDAVFAKPNALLQMQFAQVQPQLAGELGLYSQLKSAAPASVEHALLPQHTGKVTFTSGSTGTPKGVCLSWQQQQQQAQSLAQAVGLQGTRHLCVLPLSTLLENIAGVYAPLLAGGSVEVCSLAQLGFVGSRLQEPPLFLQRLSVSQPQTLILIPQLLHLLVQAVQQGWQPPALQFIAVGGSRVAASLVQQARAAGLPVYEGYGLSECASVVSLNTPQHDKLGTAGKLLPQVKVSLVNQEIHVSGNAMLGYMGEPASWHQQAIATGDLGDVDADGFVRILGRCKHVLISSYGRNIAPEWVESELLATPLLSEAVVFGDAQPYCVALVSPRDPRLTDSHIQQVIDLANQQLPDYAQVQRWHRLAVPLAQNPQLITANGRPRRAAIAEHYAEVLAALYETAVATATATATATI